MLNWSRVSSETLHQAQLNFSSGRIVPGGSRITDGDAGNYMVNPRKRPNLLASMGPMQTAMYGQKTSGSSSRTTLLGEAA